MMMGYDGYSKTNIFSKGISGPLAYFCFFLDKIVNFVVYLQCRKALIDHLGAQVPLTALYTIQYYYGWLGGTMDRVAGYWWRKG